jgi:hypothetical protein
MCNKQKKKNPLQEVYYFLCEILVLKGVIQYRSYGDKGNGNSGTEEGYI